MSTKVTYRQCIGFNNVAAELKSRGSFIFRVAIAGIFLETSKKVTLFQESQKTVKGIDAFQEEINLHRENCTIDKNGKKEINVEAFMPLLKKSQLTHKPALTEAEKLQKEANDMLDNSIDIEIVPLTMAMLTENDEKEHFESTVIARLLPFMEK